MAFLAHSPQISGDSIVRMKAVLQMVQLSRSSVYAFIKAGTFPAPVKLGARAVGFLLSEIRKWIEDRRSSCAKD